MSTDTVVLIETPVYSVEQGTLLWEERSETTSAKDVRKSAKELGDAAGNEMREAGLVGK